MAGVAEGCVVNSDVNGIVEPEEEQECVRVEK
jgi:hypothetical protein